MAKNCGVGECLSVPEFYCDCERNNFFCRDHLQIHSREMGESHAILPLTFVIEDEMKEKVIKGINLRCKLIEKIKAELNKNCVEIVEHTVNECRKITNKLNENKKYYKLLKKMLLQKNQIDIIEYEKGTFLEESYVKFFSDIEVIKDQIDILYLNNSTVKEIHKHLYDDDECFWISGVNLFTVDLENFKKTAHILNYSFDANYNDSCKLPDGKFFAHSHGSNNCYILDSKNSSVTQIPSFSGSSRMSAVGYIHGNVYIINGYSSISNEKYNIFTKKWSKFAPCPLTEHHNSGGVILENICITCFVPSTPYIYDPNTNQYTAQMKIEIECFKPVGHGYIMTNECIYKVQGHDTNKWIAIQYKGSPPNFDTFHGNSNVFKKGKYLYVITNSFKLWQIDTILYEARIIEPY